MANNAFPRIFLCRFGGDCTHPGALPQVFAPQQNYRSGRCVTATCSGFRDIHKNLWISLWIIYE
jgi:hypothetical protein